MSELDKLDFAKQVVEIQAQVKEMEAQADAKDRPRDEVRERPIHTATCIHSGQVSHR